MAAEKANISRTVIPKPPVGLLIRYGEIGTGRYLGSVELEVADQAVLQTILDDARNYVAAQTGSIVIPVGTHNGAAKSQ
jgi:hypothetical protein